MNVAELARERLNRRDPVVFQPVQQSAVVRLEMEALGKEVVRAWRDGIRDELLPMLWRRQTVDGLTTDDLAGDIEALMDRIAGSALVAELSLRVRRAVFRAEAIHRNRFTGTIRAGTGLDVGDLIASLQAADEVAARQRDMVALIRNVSEQIRDEVAGITFRAVADRQSPRDTAKALRERLKFGRRRALRIASDQSSKLHSTLTELRFREAGLETYEWQHSGAQHPRDDHVRRDGRIFRWDGPPADGHPGVAINCKCSARAVLEFD